jgi:AbrB family looped-hinge helix DNA binding protein
METTRLSTKGQIILPKSIRTSRGWGPGTEFIVEEVGSGIVLRPAPRLPQTTLEEVAGCLKPRKKSSLSRARIEAAVKREVMERHARGRY